MDIEAFPSPPVPLDIDTAIISEQSQLEEASNDQEMPSLISFSTPVKANKRRKITDQQKVDTEDECMDKGKLFIFLYHFDFVLISFQKEFK